MRVLLFILLIGLGLVMHQADADHADIGGTGAMMATMAHDGSHDCTNGHGEAEPDGDMDCGMHATCCPPIASAADELSLDHVPMTGQSTLQLDYSSPNSPPAAPPPRS